MRKKKHGAERIAACNAYLIPTPSERIAEPTAFFPHPERPLCLEIGCGKGDFAVGMAKKYPNINFIAMEKFADAACLALEKAVATAGEREEDNLRFLIGDAKNLTDWFPASVFSGIYLNFSDPWPKKGHSKRRLTYRAFLAQYKELLLPDGVLYFKTDNAGLFDFSMKEFAAFGTETLFYTRDLHHSELAADNIETEYERNFSAKGFDICSAHVRFLDRTGGVEETILAARSYRSFSPDCKLTRDQVLYFVDNARRCSSARNAQPLRYRIVTDTEECAKTLPLTSWAGALSVKLPPEGHEPSAYILICVDPAVTESLTYQSMDTGIAAEAILLSAAEQGFGGCMIAAFDREKIKSVLHIPEHLTPMLLLALGKPDEQVKLCDFKGDGIPSYFRENGIHYVPKRTLDDILL